MSELDNVMPVAPKPKKLKGNASWRPMSEDLLNRDKGFDYRKVRFNNVNRLIQQGWQLVKAEEGGGHEVVDGGNRIFGGSRVDSLAGGTGFVYMRLPQDGADARDEYRQGKAQRQLTGIEAAAQREVGIAVHTEVPGTDTKGISISQKGAPIKQVIE